MDWSFSFVLNSILLGVGLAMDAFSVSLANGLNEPHMRLRKMFIIAGTFAVFQALMPMLGWNCVHQMLHHFHILTAAVPWLSLLFLTLIGGGMISEGVQCRSGSCEPVRLGAAALLMQAIATSIDALSVGFTIAEYEMPMALACSLIIAAVTFCICLAGVVLGRKIGVLLSGKALIFGGVILILVGLEIWGKHFLR